MSIRLELQLKDKDIIEKFKNVLNLTSKITYSKHKKNGVISESVIISFCSIKMAKDLEKYGIVPNKTYITKHLPTIPEEFERHFLRGLIDGDGSIYQRKNHNKKNNKDYNSYTLYFCSYHQSCCEDFQKFAIKYTSRKKKMNISKEKKSQYRIIWTAKQDVKELVTALYKDSNFYLARKYELAKQIFEGNDEEDIVYSDH